MNGSDLISVSLAVALAAGGHALVRRLERWLPARLAQQEADPSARAARAARLRGPIALSLLVPKVLLWACVVAWVAERLMPVGEARDALLAVLRASLRAPIFEAQGRGWNVGELLTLPALLVGVWIGVGLLARGLRWQLARAGGMESGVADTLSLLVRYGIGALAALVVLQVWGFDVRSFALLGGVVGVGLGFGLQNITSNFVSGVLIAFERPIKPGDFVRVGEFTGTVQRIGARSTAILTPDRISVLVPNARFLEGEVVNWSHGSPVCRLHLPVGVAYGSDPAQVRAALLEAARGHPKVLADPRPDVDLDGFGDSALLFDLEVWTADPAAQAETTSDLYYRIEASLRRRGIVVPFPQRDLHLRDPALVRLADAYGRRAFPDWDEAPAAVPAAPVAAAAVQPVLAARPAAWGDDELAALAARMRAPGGVAIADRRHRLTVHPRCLLGSEAVDWLVGHEGLTRAESVLAGRRLIERGFLHHVLDEHGFEDGHLFYRFYADEEPAPDIAGRETS